MSSLHNISVCLRNTATISKRFFLLQTIKLRCFHSSVAKRSSSTSLCPGGLSYVHASSSVPLLGVTISRLVDDAVDRYGSDQEAVFFCRQNIRKNFVELREDVDRLATGLLSLGLRRGDRVGIWGPNSYEWLLAEYATARAGLILVCINPAYQANELKYCLNKVEVSAVISAESYKKQNYYEIINEAAPEIRDSKTECITCKSIPSLKFLILMSDKKHPGALRFQDLMQAGGNTEKNLLSQLIDDVQPDDPCQIQFTSGTTGYPKGATLSHHGIVNNAYYVGRRMDFHGEHHSLCVIVPLYHCMGSVMSACNVFLHGIRAVFPTPTFEAQSALAAITQENCTAIYGTPTMFIDMLNHPQFNSYDFSKMKSGLMSGALCPEELVCQTAEKMKMKNFMVVYGTTETSPVILAARIGDSIQTRSTKVGYPIDNVEVKIVDENGKTVPIGTPGELWARGFLTMLGYWNDEAKTKEVFSSGWYRTGDVLSLDENGYGQIIGRMKDMVIRGGENIYPAEIENLLHTHHGIADAHVFGIPDKRMGEELCVWIKLKAGHTMTKDDVHSFCKGKISHFKIPKHVHFVDTYPMTVTGKIKKFVMRKEMIELLCM